MKYNVVPPPKKQTSVSKIGKYYQTAAQEYNKHQTFDAAPVQPRQLGVVESVLASYSTLGDAPSFDLSNIPDVDPSNDPSFGSRILDVLSRPLFGVANLAKEGLTDLENRLETYTKRNGQNVDFNEYGFTHPHVLEDDEVNEQQEVQSIPEAFGRGFAGKDKTTFRDVVKEADPQAPNWVQGGLGLAGDLVFDPLNAVPGLGFAKIGRASKEVIERLPPAVQDFEKAAVRGETALPAATVQNLGKFLQESKLRGNNPKMEFAPNPQGLAPETPKPYAPAPSPGHTTRMLNAQLASDDALRTLSDVEMLRYPRGTEISPLYKSVEGIAKVPNEFQRRAREVADARRSYDQARYGGAVRPEDARAATDAGGRSVDPTDINRGVEVKAETVANVADDVARNAEQGFKDVPDVMLGKGPDAEVVNKLLGQAQAAQGNIRSQANDLAQVTRDSSRLVTADALKQGIKITGQDFSLATVAGRECRSIRH
jgi:hypothetical protein